MISSVDLCLMRQLQADLALSVSISTSSFCFNALHMYMTHIKVSSVVTHIHVNTLHYALYTTYTTLHYTTLHYTTLHYTLHYIILKTVLHCTLFNPHRVYIIHSGTTNQIVEIFEQQGQKRNLQYREIIEPTRSEDVCSSE